ncbi:hypothetical protein DFS34DRAFT_58186 [Phlyctochytrium arcticum]|nr:hypothetical protein DFS34DRAFT_58186 [Phlyctochytrium arcticum]
MALMTGTCIGEDTGHDDEQNTQTSSSTPVINPSRRTSNDSSDQRLDSPSPRSSPIASPVVAPDASYLRTALTTVRIISLLHCPSNFNDSGIHALPLELLIRIFSFLDVRARCRACQVSWSWQHVLYSSPKLWQRLDLSNRLSLGGDKTVGKEGGRAESVLLTLLQRPVGARRFSRLTRLDMSCTDVNPQVFSNPVVQNALRSSLSHLILNGCAHMDSGSVYHLKGLTALKALEISHCEQVDDTGLEAISFFLPHLTHLNLSYLFRVTESGVNRLFRMSNLVSLNLMGCYRIKQYPWAVSDGSQRSVLPIKEMMLGEDSRIQTRGFWLLWCTFNFNTQRLASLCPFMETLRLNMVLFDLPSDGLAALVNGFPRLKHLSLVVDRAAVTALCGLADKLGNLETLEATIHIGVTADLITALVKAKAFAKLRALKFHSKHTTVFTDRTLKALITAAPTLEYLELNGDEITADGLDPIATQLGKTLQSLLVHHIRISNTTFKNLSKSMMQVRELTMTDVQQQSYSNRLRCLVDHASICNRLKKIELSSVRGFTDRDLASIPQTCPQLQ